MAIIHEPLFFTMNKGNQTKNDLKQEQLLLTLGGLKPTLESGF